MGSAPGADRRAAPIRVTPLVPFPGRAGVLLKLESLQRTGSFKLRGAWNRLLALSPAERERGVVTASAGNHGLGVALSAAELGVRAEVVLPATSPQVKRRAIAALGAQVLEGGRVYDEAERAARARAAATGATFVSAYDDPWVIRGNGGSLGEEIARQTEGVTRVVVPVGGGGMIAGLAEALAPRGVQVVGVQPAGNCAMRRSLELGRALTEYDGEPTLAEGCEGAVCERTYEACRRHGVTVELVAEVAIRRAMAFAYRRAGQIVEPSAAVAIAGILEGAVAPAAGTTVVVTSGGNVDPELLDQVLADPEP
jgi:threonine dehydratase